MRAGDRSRSSGVWGLLVGALIAPLIRDLKTVFAADKPKLATRQTSGKVLEKLVPAVSILTACTPVVSAAPADARPIEITHVSVEVGVGSPLPVHVVASGSWPFQVNLLKGEKKPIASVVPEEGATG